MKAPLATRVSHWVNVFFFSALLHRPRKAAGYAVPTATAPLRGLLHCLPCVARLKEANNHQMADPVYNAYRVPRE